MLGLIAPGRPYAGYHALHTVMVPLDVGDELSVEAAAGLSLRVEGADLPTDGRNLVYRAARAYLDAAGNGAGAAIALHKRLPLAAGLGGGSSDAATTLLALSRLSPSDVDLPALAVRLGADVPFFLMPGAALASGIGERLTPLRLPPVHLVLYNPGIAVSAADAYRWLDESGHFTPPLDLPEIVAALQAGRTLPYHNALQPGVVARHPVIAGTLEALETAGLHSPLMSGSGSTCFALAHTRAQAEAAAEQLRANDPESWIVAASSTAD